MGQQQHFTPYERNHLGLISSTEYMDRGAWTQSALQYGTYDNLSYGVEAGYRNDPGQWQNNDVEDKLLSLQLKWQLTPADNLYAEVTELRRENGDLNQYYNPDTMHSPSARYDEKQDPVLVLGYNHEWQPGVHTLFMASRLRDDYSFNGYVPAPILIRWANLTTDPYELVGIRGGTSIIDDYHTTMTLYTTEAQQIIEQDDHTTIFGGRYQYGSLNTDNYEYHPSSGVSWDEPPADQNLDNTLKRYSVYGYHLWQIADPLQLIGGLNYEWMEYPVNVSSPPISSQSETTGQLSPKAGFIWTPLTNTTVRFAYTKSLGGQNLDQSMRIEPTQVAGFQQTFRSLIGEPSVAHTGAPEDETFGLSLEQKFSTGTYLGLTGEILKSKVNQTIGAFEGLWDLNDFYVPGGLKEDLHYREQSLQFTVNQLLGRDWALGAQYRISHSKLTDNYPEVSQNWDHIFHSPDYPFDPYQSLEATLNQVNLFAIYNLPCGFFAESDARWFGQNNSGYSPSMSGDSFWQFDAFVGYRFLQRRMQVSLGLLNLTDQDYQLNPLNAYSAMPRERTFVARFLFNF